MVVHGKSRSNTNAEPQRFLFSRTQHLHLNLVPQINTLLILELFNFR